MDFELGILNSLGEQIELWEITKCKILEVDFGELNYSDDRLTNITIKLRPKEVKLKY